MRSLPYRRAAVTPLLLVGALLLSQAARADGKAAIFIKAKEAFANKEFAKAADRCHRYLRASKPVAEKYESAQYFLGASLERLGFYHAAIEHYVQVATNRRSPELLPRTIRALERIALERPIDEALVLRDLIGDTDFGAGLPPDVADFVFYWQGMTNLRRGLDEWANERLLRIQRRGYYFYAGLYAMSVRLLAPIDARHKERAVEGLAKMFGALDLVAALESLRRRGESDSKLAYSLKALLNKDNEVAVRFDSLPKGWEVELALLGLARIDAETDILLKRSRQTEEEELGRPFAYQVQIGGIPIYRRSPRFEDRSPMIKAVAARRTAVRKIRGKAMHALARLLYEQKRFAAAYDVLGKIPPKTELSSEILLERAWAKYKAGDEHRAMGLLFALDAPVYRNLFAPDKYVLRGLIYRRFCHFRAAKIAARRYRLHYAKTLEKIREGTRLKRIRRVRAAALRRGRALKLYLLLRTLRDEYQRTGQYEDWNNSGLTRLLSKLYRSKRRQIRADLGRALEVTTREVAEQMLAAEEQVHLLEYEVGQAIFQRVSDLTGAAHTRKPAAKVPITANRIYYRFNSEYWTDELPHYKFNISDRCVE